MRIAVRLKLISVIWLVGVSQSAVTARIHPIIRLITFAGGSHGSDFGFGAGARALLSGVADCTQNQSGENKDDSEYNKQLDEGECAGALLTDTGGGPVGQPFDTETSAGSGGNFSHHSSFELRHFGEAVHVCCCKPVMILMSGVNRASTIVPTITARNTIMSGSSMEVRATTALSTSSS